MSVWLHYPTNNPCYNFHPYYTETVNVYISEAGAESIWRSLIHELVGLLSNILLSNNWQKEILQVWKHDKSNCIFYMFNKKIIIESLLNLFFLFIVDHSAFSVRFYKLFSIWDFFLALYSKMHSIFILLWKHYLFIKHEK